MKPLITATLGALAMAVAAPAFAQPSGWNLDRREQWLAERIDRAVSDGSLDDGEARRVRRELHGIREEQDRMLDRDSGHLNDEDRTALEERLDDLSSHIHWLRQNGDVAPWRR